MDQSLDAPDRFEDGQAEICFSHRRQVPEAWAQAVDMPQNGGHPTHYDGSPDAKREIAVSAIVAARPSLSISPEKVCFFVLKAREFDVKDVVTDPDSGSNPSDDAMISVLEDHPDDPTQQELRAFIDALTEDEQVDLVALTWLGRGDGTIEDWEELRQEAQRLHNNRTAAYLLGKPMLADHLQEGLVQLGCSCDDF
jgi:hypothetical protein